MVQSGTKNGSGLDPEKEPHWDQILNPVFAETHKPLNLVSNAAEILSVNEIFQTPLWKSLIMTMKASLQVSVDLIAPI